MIKLEFLNQDDLNYVWDNLRKIDSLELSQQNITDKNKDEFLDHDSYSIYNDDKLIGLLGMQQYSHVMMVFFMLGTDDIDGHFTSLTKVSQRFINSREKLFPGRKSMILVWEKNTKSISWITRVLGFSEIGILKTLVVMER